MKKALLFFTLLCSLQASAGSFLFPNVEYDFARLYLFNCEYGPESVRPEFSIYQNGIYAASKLGNGTEVTPEMVAEMNAIFSKGVGILVAGLSGCYIPRHGIIYFDKTGNPVASFSVCFECQRVHFWSTAGIPKYKEPKYSDKTTKIAEKQFADLEALFVKHQVPVFAEPLKYVEHKRTATDLYEDNGEITFNFTNVSAFGTKTFTAQDIKSWNMQPDQFRLREAKETRFSQREGDNDSWDYLTLITENGTKIVFSDLDSTATMTEATIVDPQLKLPNGVSVGMSLDQVQGTFQVWDGIAWPASIIANYTDATIRYTIDNRTLRKIDVVII